MKKFLLSALLIIGFSCVYAQSYDTLRIEDVDGTVKEYCCNDDDFLGVIINGTGCEGHNWVVYPSIYSEYTDSIVINKTDEQQDFEVFYVCGEDDYYCYIIFVGDIMCPFDEQRFWKHYNDSIVLDCKDRLGEWSTGEVGRYITVSTSGTYSVTFTNYCDSATYSVDVIDCPEIYRVSVDLLTGHNKITWSTENSDVFERVKIIRDNVEIGETLYSNGLYIDDIGSEDNSHNYQIVGILHDGTECPLRSYVRGTPHAQYYPDFYEPETHFNVTWDKPFNEDSIQVVSYKIYKYDPVYQQLTLKKTIEPQYTQAHCKISDFAGGYAVLGVVYDDGRDYEDISFAAKSYYFSDSTAVDENLFNRFTVFPNPSNGIFTVEGAKTLSISNVLGRVITESYSEEEMHHLSMEYLSPGVYFISDGVITKKLIITR